MGLIQIIIKKKVDIYNLEVYTGYTQSGKSLGD